MEKIKINIKTNSPSSTRKYIEISYVVDGEKFQSEMLDFRNRLRNTKHLSDKSTLNSLPITYKDFDLWLNTLVWGDFTKEEETIRSEILKNIEEYKFPLSRIVKPKQTATITMRADGFVTPEISEYEKSRKTLTLEGSYFFYLNIVAMRKRLELPYYFDGVLAKSLVCGEVRLEDYGELVVRVGDKNMTLDSAFNDLTLRHENLSINIDTNTTDREIIVRKKKILGLLSDKYNGLPKITAKLRDVAISREYWWRSKEETPYSFAEDLIDEGTEVGELESVRRNVYDKVKRYDDFLKEKN